ncbi:hypothetical protein ATY75_12265 [Rhizobium sp. N122]|uniref:hypothetical protein n=1 Tax=Rhizobium sp. N122 TaxID=1764272 RepID=UPI000B5A85C6|nr:hypothetical protein [Rhizobium sp. N122]OWV62591.1 hypothetical protein ATY75_12265 [Rhizobium sp. N122]
MAERLGVTVSWIGTICTVIMLLFFGKLALDGQMTWAFWPTTITAIVCFLPHLAGRAIRYVLSGF